MYWVAGCITPVGDYHLREKKIETLLNKPLAFTSGSTEKNQKAHQFASNYLLDLLDCCLKLVKRFAAFLLKNREKCLV